MSEPRNDPEPPSDPDPSAPTEHYGLADRPTRPLEAPASEAGPPSSVLSRLGDYELLGELARGGMGVVYRARHVPLDRLVALKVIRTEIGSSPQLLERFRREARAAAKLLHPGIVPIHDLGHVDGVNYFTMDLVPGRDLTHAMEEADYTPRQGLAWLRQVCEAVEYAHINGVTHRDLKPGNILIREDGQPLITDFGLAKDASQAAITGSKDLLGTPLYMAAEQLGDGEVGPATDLYALGVIAYQIVSEGYFPFEGANTAELFYRIAHERPHPLSSRKPGLDRDIVTLVHKAIERAPADRYPSARALAEDLRRYLAGEAITARPPGLLERLHRTLRAHRTAARIGAAVLVVVLGLAGWALHSRLEAERQARRAAERKEQAMAARLEASQEKLGRTLAEQEAMTQLGKRAGLAFSAALALRRLGQLQPMRRFIDETRIACAEANRVLPGRPEADYYLGRIYRAHLDDRKALEHQRRALELAPRFPPALYELVVLLGEAYRKRLIALLLIWRRDRARQGRGPTEGHTPWGRLIAEDPLASGLRDQIRAAQEQLRERPGRLGRSQRDWAAALTDWVTRGNPAAPAMQRIAAGERAPVEAIATVMLIDDWSGRHDKAMDWARRGIRRDRGYLPFWRQRAQMRTIHGFAQMSAGTDPRAEFRQALTELEQALKISPTDPQLRMMRGSLLGHLACPGYWPGSPELFPKAIEALDGLATDPAVGLDARLERGMIRVNWGLHLLRTGGDPRPVLRQALSDFGRVKKGRPAQASLLDWEANLHNNWGTYLSENGEDPSGRFARAIESAAASIQADPRRSSAWRIRGGARINLAQHRANTGENPLPLLKAGIKDLERASELTPSNLTAHEFIGHAQQAWAEHLRKTGGDAASRFREAIRSYGRVIERHARHAGARYSRGDARERLALLLQSQGADSTALLRAAIEDFTAALRLRPGHLRALLDRGRARMQLANQLAARTGRSQLPTYRLAIADLDRVLERAPDRVPALVARGGCLVNSANLQGAMGGDARPLYQRAIKDLTRAARLAPRDLLALQFLASAWYGLAWYLDRRKLDPARACRGGIAAQTTLARLLSRRAEPLMRRAQLRAMLAGRRQATPAEIAGHYRAADADLKEAGRREPRNPLIPSTRAVMHHLWGVARARTDPRSASAQFQAAVEGFTLAARLAPGVADHHYNLACALSRRATTHPADPAGERRRAADLAAAIEALGRAVQRGTRRSGLKRDEDLTPLHGQPAFERLAAGK